MQKLHRGLFHRGLLLIKSMLALITSKVEIVVQLKRHTIQTLIKGSLPRKGKGSLALLWYFQIVPLIALVRPNDGSRLYALSKKIVDVNGVVCSALCDKSSVITEIGDLIKAVFAHIVIADVFEVALSIAIGSFKTIHTKAIAAVAGLVSATYYIRAAFIFATHHKEKYGNRQNYF